MSTLSYSRETTARPAAPSRAIAWGEWKKLSLILGAFFVLLILPVGHPRFDGALDEALYLTQWYAREHVLLCLVPAFFIAGAIGVFVSQASVMKYLGATAPKWLAYGVASVSGTILAVCSCTVLPLFAGIWRMGAGLGPATAFLYSGPAINVLAIILTARVLGLELGTARAVGAVGFSVVVGLLMHLIYRKEEAQRAATAADVPAAPAPRPLGQTAVYFALMVAVLVFANWGQPQSDVGIFSAVHSVKWIITSLAGAGLGLVMVLWFGVSAVRALIAAAATGLAAFVVPDEPVVPFSVAATGLAVIIGTGKGEIAEWFDATWEFAKQILPLLLIGVLVAGFLLGRPGHEGLIPSRWIVRLVGGNSLSSNFFAALAGALMYFATLTEIPILQGLIGSGMGKGPALALLLAGPALSLPSMLVLRGILGTQKTIVFVSLVVFMAAVSGWLYGTLFP